MNRVAAALALLIVFLTGPAFGAEIFAAIPDNCAVIAVTPNYRESLDAARGFLDASAPKGVVLPQGAVTAGLPMLGGVVAARNYVEGLLAEKSNAGIASDKPAALVVLAWGKGLSGSLWIRTLDEAAWRRAHKGAAGDTVRGGEPLPGGGMNWYEIHSGFLITCDDVATLDAYDAAKARPLGSERTSALNTMLVSEAIAVNVSAPAATRAWKASKMEFCASGGEQVAASTRCKTQGVEGIFVPASVFSKGLADFLANGDEAYFAVRLAPQAMRITGKLLVEPDSVYATVLSEQKGRAPAALGSLSERPAAGLGVSLGGDVFWAYATSFLSPFADGMAIGSESNASSLTMLNDITDEFRRKIGLGKVTFLWTMHDDWRRPTPVLVADVSDSRGSVDFLAGAIKRAYGDTLMKSYCRSLGFILRPPVLENEASQPYTAVINVPFKMSATDPVKAARMLELLGSNLTWRVAAVTRGSRRLVVAGDFKDEASLAEFVSRLNPECPPASNVAAGGSRIDSGGSTIASAFVDLPQYLAGLFEGALRQGGALPGRPMIPSTGDPCQVSLAADMDLVRLSMIVPSQQVRDAFAAVANVAVSASTKAAPCPVPSKKKSGAKTPSAGEEGSGESVAPPWGK